MRLRALRTAARAWLPAAALATVLAAAGCAGPPAPALTPAPGPAALALLGEQRIALRQPFRDTIVGGLSGIDYDARSGTWFLVSDDRSALGPARLYTATMRYDANGFHALALDGVIVPRQADGTVFPGRRQWLEGRGEVPDFEAVRIDPQDGSLWLATEGDCSLKEDPAVIHVARDGRYLSRIAAPAMFAMCRQAGYGSRDNLTFEGLSFSHDGSSLWVAMEGPLQQDGPEPARGHGAVARITEFARDGRVLRQVAYPVDAIPAMPGQDVPANNGVTEILAVDAHRLLVLERAAVRQPDGSFANDIRLYEMDLRGASDIRDLPALAGADYVPARKRLVSGLRKLALPRLDNLEGLAWGPKTGRGCATLAMVSDDNFNPRQVMQVLAFDVLPDSGICPP